MNKQMKQHLETVVNSIVNEDAEAATAAFHDYLRMKTQTILLGEGDDEECEDDGDKKDDKKDDKKKNPFAKKSKDEDKDEDEDEDEKKSKKGKAKKLDEADSSMIGNTMSLEGEFTTGSGRPVITTMVVRVVQMPGRRTTGDATPSNDHFFVKVLQVGQAAKQVVQVGQIAHMYFDGNSATVNNYDPDDGFYVPGAPSDGGRSQRDADSSPPTEWSLTDPDIYRSDE